MYNDTALNSTASSALGGAIIAFLAATWFICLALGIVVLIANWKMYEKAGKPGWASIIPIYNLVVRLEIVGLPTWMVLLYIIPIVNFIAMPILEIIVNLKLAKSFGQSTGFGIGLIFLNAIFIPILAFGKSTYVGPQEI